MASSIQLQRSKKPANTRALLFLLLFSLLMCTGPLDCSVQATDTPAMTATYSSVQLQAHEPEHARHMNGFAIRSMLDEEAAIEALATLFVMIAFTALAWKP